tara:strand:- start:717 stop:881 length:165 start_codon:yes stop_codon:yes gene_type:complete
MSEFKIPERIKKENLEEDVNSALELLSFFKGKTHKEMRKITWLMQDLYEYNSKL